MVSTKLLVNLPNVLVISQQSVVYNGEYCSTQNVTYTPFLYDSEGFIMRSPIMIY